MHSTKTLEQPIDSRWFNIGASGQCAPFSFSSDGTFRIDGCQVPWSLAMGFTSYRSDHPPFTVEAYDDTLFLRETDGIAAQIRRIAGCWFHQIVGRGRTTCCVYPLILCPDGFFHVIGFPDRLDATAPVPETRIGQFRLYSIGNDIVVETPSRTLGFRFSNGEWLSAELKTGTSITLAAVPSTTADTELPTLAELQAPEPPKVVATPGALVEFATDPEVNALPLIQNFQHCERFRDTCVKFLLPQRATFSGAMAKAVLGELHASLSKDAQCGRGPITADQGWQICFRTRLRHGIAQVSEVNICIGCQAEDLALAVTNWFSAENPLPKRVAPAVGGVGVLSFGVPFLAQALDRPPWVLGFAIAAIVGVTAGKRLLLPKFTKPKPSALAKANAHWDLALSALATAAQKAGLGPLPPSRPY